MYTYCACIIHLDMYTHDGHMVSPCTQIIANTLFRRRANRDI